jgi:hypothetical protein
VLERKKNQVREHTSVSQTIYLPSAALNLLAADQVVFGQLNIYSSHHNHFCWKMRCEMSNKLFQGDLEAEILPTEMYFLELQA